MSQTKYKFVRRMVNDYKSINSFNASVIPGFTNVSEKKHSNLYRGTWLVLILLGFSGCIYQAGNSVAYFQEKPYKVQTEIVASDQDTFAITIHLSNTDESDVEMDKVLAKYFNATRKDREKIPVCYSFPPFFFDNQTDIYESWKSRNTTKHLTDFVYIKGKEIRSDILTVKEHIAIAGVPTELKCAKGLDPAARIELKTKFRYKNAFTFAVSFLPNDEGRDNPMVTTDKMHFARSEKRNEFFVTYRKYQFLNRRDHPCVDRTVKEKCYFDCFAKFSANFTCQLPYLPQIHKKNCTANPQTCKYCVSMYKLRNTIYPMYECGCPRECNKMVITSNYHTIDGRYETFSFYATSDQIQILTEYFCYDFISLLCDIGGFLGFYIGFSCLSLTELVFGIGVQQYKKYVFNRQYNNYLSKRVVEKINETLKEQQLDDVAAIVNSKFQLCTKWLKIIFYVASICFCAFIMYLELQMFFQFPVYITIEIEQDKFIQVPPVVLCSEPDSFIFDKVDVKNQLNVSCAEDVDNLDLLDVSPAYKHDVEKIWEESIDKNEFEMVDEDTLSKFPAFNFRSGEISIFPTVYGNCLKMTSDKIEFNPLTQSVYLVHFEKAGDCNLHQKIFLMKSDDQIDYSTYLYHPPTIHARILQVVLRRQIIKRLSTPTNPCTSLASYQICQKNCFAEDFKKRTVHCRLPFMESSTLPLCNKTKEAKATRKAYLQTHARVSIEDCKCLPLCMENIYIPDVEFGLFPFPIIFARFSLENNNYEVFKQERHLKGSKLIGDIGGIMGFLIGVSVLSVLDMFGNVISSIYASIIKKFSFRL